jgi:hypothetical protein
MGQPSSRYSPAGRRWVELGPRRSRKRPLPERWPEPKDDRLTLSQATPGGSQWGEAIAAPMAEDFECVEAEATANIPQGYVAAIALLRYLRNASEEEAQRQRESWELLKHDLDENKYH